MSHPQLTPFIDASRAQGLDDAQIRQTLLEKGWQADIVDDAFGGGGASAPAQAPQNEENIIDSIANIKVAGTATMGYWNIIRTNKALYFLKTGSALGLGVGTNNLLLAASVIGDVIASQKAKTAGQSPLQEALAQAKESYRFLDSEMNTVVFKKGLFGGKIIFPNGKEKSWRESGIVKLKLSYGRWKKLMTLIQPQ